MTTTEFTQARADDGRAVLEGFHALKHALRFGATILRVAAVDPEHLEQLAAELAPDLLGRFRELASPVSRDEFRLLSRNPVRTEVIAIAERPVIDTEAVLHDVSAPPIVFLEDPRNLGNVGAVIRVAAAAGAAAVLTDGVSDPWDPAAIRGSAGLHYALPVAKAALHSALPVAKADPRNAVPAAKADPRNAVLAAKADPRNAVPAAKADPHTLGHRPLVALHPDGVEISPQAIPDRAILAFGTERDGLSPALLDRADVKIRIPMRPGVSSLNLATSVAITLYSRSWTARP
jgi:TrmH family RNA methyltransferase